MLLLYLFFYKRQFLFFVRWRWQHPYPFFNSTIMCRLTIFLSIRGEDWGGEGSLGTCSYTDMHSYTLVSTNLLPFPQFLFISLSYHSSPPTPHTLPFIISRLKLYLSGHLDLCYPCLIPSLSSLSLLLPSFSHLLCLSVFR